MTPAARYAAACDILDQVVAGHPTERALLAWARGSRYAGSKDRAAVRDIVFDAIRSWNSCAALGGGTNGRARILGLLRLTGVDPSGVFTGLGYAMDALTPEEVALWDTPGAPVADVPAWVLPEITRSLGADTQSYLDTLRHRAPVWLRVNTVRATPEQARASLARDGIATA
ncbi:MAG: RsmB/NOP family class I SAM-dependent RNA methyltransferase, partial [Primorskyibacter sp.]